MLVVSTPNPSVYLHLFSILCDKLRGSFLALFLLCFALVFSSSAEVPRTLFYQGRLLDHQSLKPVLGTFTNQSFRVLIHKLSNPGSAPLLDRTLQGITVTNGLFTLSIDTSAQPGETPLTFDAPYLVEVVLGGSSGGRVGQQVFSSMPYAFGSENALNLNSIGPLAYATKGHGLETPGTSSFTIDGSAETKASQDQLLICYLTAKMKPILLHTWITNQW